MVLWLTTIVFWSIISSMRRKSKNTVTKIEFDEQTNEPIIIEVPIEEAKKQAKDNPPEIKKADFFEDKDGKSFGKQVIMPQVLGIKKEDKAISKRKKILKIVVVSLFIVFVVGVLAYTFYNDFFANPQPFPTGEELLKIFSSGWFYLLCALLSLSLCYIFKALKLSVSCKSLTGKFHFKTCLETGIIGHYYNSVTPLAVGGQPFEIYHLSKHGIHGGVASALPIATYILNQFAFVISALIFLLLLRYNALCLPPELLGTIPPAYTALAVVGMVCCAALPLMVAIFCLTPRFGSRIIRGLIRFGAKLKLIKDPQKTTYKTIKNIFHNSQCVKSLFVKPASALLSFFLSFLEVLATASIAYFSLKTFGYPTFNSVGGVLEWLQICQISVLISCAVSFVPTPGNAGASDLSFFEVFKIGLAGGLAFPSMMIWRSMSFYAYIVIGFVFATLKKRADRRREAKLNAPL